MANPAPWRPLPLTTSILSAPSLLLQTHFTESAYTIHLTDLVTLWTETLTPAALLSRAASSASSIDPSEDPEQLQLLLDTLSTALHTRSRDTELALHNAHDGGVLALTLTHQLPAGLDPLRWSFNLQKRPQVEFTNLFVMPLVGAVGVQAELLDALRRKDGVIGRMRDALEGKMRIEDAVGRTRMRALVAFDREKWEEKVAGGERSGAEVVMGVFGAAARVPLGKAGSFGGEAEAWWKGVAGDADAPLLVQATGKNASVVPAVDEETEDEDVKPSPAKWARGGRRKESFPPADMDGDEDEHPPPPPPPPVKKTLGKIGGKRALSPLPATDDETTGDDEPAVVKKPIGSIGSHKTASTLSSAYKEVGNDAGLPAVKKPIGKIGGRKAAPAPTHVDCTMTELAPEEGKIAPRATVKQSSGPATEEAAEPRNEDTTDLDKPVRKPIGKIGKIGGRKITPKTEDESAGSSSSPIKKEDNSTASLLPTAPPPIVKLRPKVESPSPEPEYDDERADRKRHLLERELEAKKKAPVRKKRKF